MRKLTKLALLGAAATLGATSANAAIVMGDVTGGNSGGVFVQETPLPGFTVGNNQQQSPNLFAFDEVQGFQLTADLAGIAAGTFVNSHYVYFDPQNSTTMEGNVTFDGNVLAILTATGQMSATDALLGNSNVTYQNPGLRGLESNDSASFAGNQVFVDLRASTPGDYIRVITLSAVPEPGTWAMMLLGFFGLGAAMRRKPATSTRVRFA
ncbi:PEPxxWA-CTERM sorting domain-containing protein [Erythrobacter sp. W53]|uniref:PEPxxWA-CTERM sorting domain-containing protein n=1 Tax=Erythrobacter sp. W53 TaxID=3425947 RepID=UPI003D768E63